MFFILILVCLLTIHLLVFPLSKSELNFLGILEILLLRLLLVLVGGAFEVGLTLEGLVILNLLIVNPLVRDCGEGLVTILMINLYILVDLL
jgi:hypothetical protein